LIAFNAEEEDRHAIRFLCSKDKSDQNIAYKKVLHFHLKLQTALRENDEETKDKLLNIINHRLELALMQKSRNGETLTSKEFEVVVGFHYRFAKTYERMAGLIGRELSTYEKRINKLFETNPTFEEKIRDVTEFNKDLRDRNWKDSIRKGKK